MSLQVTIDWSTRELETLYQLWPGSPFLKYSQPVQSLTLQDFNPMTVGTPVYTSPWFCFFPNAARCLVFPQVTTGLTCLLLEMPFCQAKFRWINESRSERNGLYFLDKGTKVEIRHMVQPITWQGALIFSLLMAGRAASYRRFFLWFFFFWSLFLFLLRPLQFVGALIVNDGSCYLATQDGKRRYWW